jgi:hypothetical protein
VLSASIACEILSALVFIKGAKDFQCTSGLIPENCFYGCGWLESVIFEGQLKLSRLEIGAFSKTELTNDSRIDRNHVFP